MPDCLICKQPAIHDAGDYAAADRPLCTQHWFYWDRYTVETGLLESIYVLTETAFFEAKRLAFAKWLTFRDNILEWDKQFSNA